MRGWKKPFGVDRFEDEVLVAGRADAHHQADDRVRLLYRVRRAFERERRADRQDAHRLAEQHRERGLRHVVARPQHREIIGGTGAEHVVEHLAQQARRAGHGEAGGDLHGILHDRRHRIARREADEQLLVDALRGVCDAARRAGENRRDAGGDALRERLFRVDELRERRGVEEESRPGIGWRQQLIDRGEADAGPDVEIDRLDVEQWWVRLRRQLAGARIEPADSHAGEILQRGRERRQREEGGLGVIDRDGRHAARTEVDDPHVPRTAAGHLAAGHLAADGHLQRRIHQFQRLRERIEGQRAAVRCRGRLRREPHRRRRDGRDRGELRIDPVRVTRDRQIHEKRERIARIRRTRGRRRRQRDGRRERRRRQHEPLLRGETCRGEIFPRDRRHRRLDAVFLCESQHQVRERLVRAGRERERTELHADLRDDEADERRVHLCDRRGIRAEALRERLQRGRFGSRGRQHDREQRTGASQRRALRDRSDELRLRDRPVLRMQAIVDARERIIRLRRRGRRADGDRLLRHEDVAQRPVACRERQRARLSEGLDDGGDCDARGGNGVGRQRGGGGRVDSYAIRQPQRGRRDERGLLVRERDLLDGQM